MPTASATTKTTCIGEVDECGICNGPGAVGDCGCDDIPDGDCDRNGNQLDALGVCGGDCTADADRTASVTTRTTASANSTPAASAMVPVPSTTVDATTFPKEIAIVRATSSTRSACAVATVRPTSTATGLCDDDEPQTCDDPEACNYDPNALPFEPVPTDEGYCAELRVIAEHDTGDLAGMTTYQVLIHTEHPTDFVTSVFGNVNDPLEVTTTTSFYHHPLGATTPENVNPLLLTDFPELAYDSWVTIGLDGPADATAGENAASTVQSPGQTWVTAFDPGGGVPEQTSS